METNLHKQQQGGDHYIKMGLQPWDVIDTWPLLLKLGFYKGNVLKYIMRSGKKGTELEDLKKAQHYLNKLIHTMESQ